jgi:hypothetical protein
MEMRRAQSTLEFLLTYGWAFLMIIAVIAGIVTLDPLGITTDTMSCQSTGTITCDNAKTEMSDSALRVHVENGGRESVVISSAETETVNDQPSDTTCTTQASLLQPDEYTTITCDSLNLVEGEQNTARITYDEYKSSQGPRYTRELEVSVEGEPNPSNTISLGGSKTAPSSLANTLSSMQGSGTPADPYTITNISELQAVDADTSAVYELANDISASNTELWNSGAGFKPIGGFSGTFDGNQYSVSGLTINRSSESKTGLFSKVNGGGTVRDVTVTDAKIIGDYDTGGLAGASDGTVRRVGVTNTYVEGDDYHTGGLIGTHDGGIVDQSMADAEVKSRSGGEAAVLVGSNHAGAKINDSYALGSVSTSTTYDTSAIVGSTSGGSYELTNVFAATEINSPSDDGLTGDSVTLNGAGYWDVDVSGKSSSESGTGLNTGDMQGSSATTNMPELDYGSTWQTTSGYPELSWE